jgi:hypothetical protein
MTVSRLLLARFSLVQTCYQIGTILMLSIGIFLQSGGRAPTSVRVRRLIPSRGNVIWFQR